MKKVKSVKIKKPKSLIDWKSYKNRIIKYCKNRRIAEETLLNKKTSLYPKEFFNSYEDTIYKNGYILSTFL